MTIYDLARQMIRTVNRKGDEERPGLLTARTIPSDLHIYKPLRMML